MLLRLFVFVLFAGTLFATSRSLTIPLAFEKTNTGYEGQASGGVIRISATAANVRMANGSFRLKFSGANPRALLTGEGDGGTQNRFLGNDPRKWKAGVPLSQRVRVRALYQGIDLVWYGKDSRLEYDLIVSPRARTDDIALQFDRDLRIDPDGNLRNDDGLLQLRPVAYQVVDGQRREIQSAFRLRRDRRIGFSVASYDHALPLIIDPALAFSTYLGGTGAEIGQATTMDALGDLYVLGSTTTTSAGNQHVLLYKIPASGSPVQSIFGGSGTDTGWALTTSPTGIVYLAGSTTSPDFPILGGIPIQVSVIGTLKAFVLALSADNSTLGFSVFFGGSYADEARGIALGANGLLYVVGDTTSPDFLQSFIGTNVFQYSNNGGNDAFLLVLSTGAVFDFATYIGGSGNDFAYGVAVGSDGSAYVVGSTSSTDFPANPPNYRQAFQETNGGGDDAFAIKIMSTGADALWSTYIGGSNTDSANAVALDAANNVYIAGTTASQNFPASTKAYQAVYQGGNSDGFVFVLPSSLPASGPQLALWSTYLGSAGDDILNAIALDSAGNIWLTGGTDSTSFPLSADAQQTANGGEDDATVSELNGAGTTLIYSTYLGGSGNEVGNGVAVNASGVVYVTGTTTSSNNDFPLVNATQKLYGGGTSDGFIAEYGCPTALPVITADGVVNAASFSAAAVSPGSVISIFGANLGCTAASAAAVPLATSLGGVTVSVNGAAVPLFYVSGAQVNAQLPYNTAIGTATITVKGPGGTSAVASVPIIEAGPGIFTVSSTTGSTVVIQAAALNQDGTLNTTSSGAKPGSVLTIYFTGQGPLDNAIATGSAAPTSPLSRATSSQSATIGGSNAVIQFLGMAPGFVGLAQANLTVPASLSPGNYLVVITINGVASQAASITVST